MAREEHDRENLLHDATTFVERIELATTDGNRVFIGFNADGAASFYFNADPVFHFNSQRQLRRAFRNGLLFKAEHKQLVSLDRVRQANEVQLRRRELPDEEAEQILNDIRHRLLTLKRDCERDSLIMVGQVPADSSVLAHVANWLAELDEIQIAESPHAC